MKVNPLLSIAAKLFYLTTGLVVGTVALISWKNSSSFREVLNQQFQRISVDGAENAGRGIEGLLTNWESRTKLVLQSYMTIPGKEKKSRTLRTFLQTGDDFVAVQIIEERAGKKPLLKTLGWAETEKTDSYQFQNKEARSVLKKVRRAARRSLYRAVKKGQAAKVETFSLAGATSLPIMTLARRYAAKGGGRVFWVLLSAWQQPLLEYLKNTTNLKGYLIDKQNRVFASHDKRDAIKRRKMGHLALVKMAAKGDIDTGFRASYRDDTGREWMGAYYSITHYGIISIFQQDASAANQAIFKMVMETLLWGALFVLIAIFVSYFGSDSLTQKLRQVIKATGRISHGDFDAHLKVDSSDEVGILTTSVNKMASQIKGFMKDQVEQARVEKELETAKAVQETLFPKENREKSVLRVAGFSTPASETGGDWWGHFTTDEGVEYIFVADAMGHGVPAALVTAMAYAACGTLVDMLKEGAETVRSPKDLVDKFNKVLHNAVEGTISMTLFALVIDYSNGTITYSNAGHNIPVLIPKDPNDKRIKKKNKRFQRISPLTPISLNLAGPTLGMDPDSVFKEKTLPLVPGDKFFLFSDGLIECKNPRGSDWGRKIMLNKILENADKSAEDMLKTIIDQAFSFYEGHPLDDDITVVTVEFPEDAEIRPRGKPKPQPSLQQAGGVAPQLPNLAADPPSAVVPMGQVPTAMPEPDLSAAVGPVPAGPAAAPDAVPAEAPSVYSLDEVGSGPPLAESGPVVDGGLSGEAPLGEGAGMPPAPDPDEDLSGVAPPDPALDGDPSGAVPAPVPDLVVDAEGPPPVPDFVVEGEASPGFALDGDLSRGDPPPPPPVPVLDVEGEGSPGFSLDGDLSGGEPPPVPDLAIAGEGPPPGFSLDGDPSGAVPPPPPDFALDGDPDEAARSPVPGAKDVVPPPPVPEAGPPPGVSTSASDDDGDDDDDVIKLGA